MTKLSKLMAEGGVTSDEARLRLVAHVLERGDVKSLDALTANDASQLITRLEKLKADGQLGAPAVQVDQAPATDPAGDANTTTTEGEQP
jgi:hypothetical protein